MSNDIWGYGYTLFQPRVVYRAGGKRQEDVRSASRAECLLNARNYARQHRSEFMKRKQLVLAVDVHRTVDMKIVWKSEAKREEQIYMTDPVCSCTGSERIYVGNGVRGFDHATHCAMSIVEIAHKIKTKYPGVFVNNDSEDTCVRFRNIMEDHHTGQSISGHTFDFTDSETIRLYGRASLMARQASLYNWSGAAKLINEYRSPRKL